jgi:hypothetical protein
VKQIRKRLTYANVMVTILAFVVLSGGAAYAASQLGKNSVGTKQIKNNAVTAAKIKNGTITGSKINLSSLGTVPSATKADTTATAASASTAGNATELGGIPASGYQEKVMWARISSIGKVSYSSGAVTGVTHTGTGEYLVTFNRNVTSCAMLVTPDVRFSGAAGPAFEKPDAVFVEFLDNLTAKHADISFSIAVFC